MKSDNVIVKESSIEGNGVFALRNFKKGEVVLHWDISHTLGKGVVNKMSSEGKKYILLLDDEYIVMQRPEKYVNHSCKPNTTTEDFCDIATRDIKNGEEIVGDYTEVMPENTTMKCKCGSKACKKIISQNNNTITL